MPGSGRYLNRLFVIVLTCAGCGEAFEPQPLSTVTITGQVRFQGVPLQGGMIVFSADPEIDGQDSVIAAELDHLGRFLLRDQEKNGVQPGHYRITVTIHPFSRASLPRKYHDPVASGLRCTVEPHQPLILNIELD